MLSSFFFYIKKHPNLEVKAFYPVFDPLFQTLDGHAIQDLK